MAAFMGSDGRWRIPTWTWNVDEDGNAIVGSGRASSIPAESATGMLCGATGFAVPDATREALAIKRDAIMGSGTPFPSAPSIAHFHTS